MSSILRSSEFWMGLVVVLTQYLASAGVVPATILGVNVANFIIAAATYVLGRLFGKAAKALVQP